MYRPIKKLGQNFLSDPNLVRRMVDALDLKSGEDVIEIGSGHGIITDYIFDATRLHGNRLIAVEIDERFYHKLHNKFVYEEFVTIVNEDILKFLPRFEPPRTVKIIGSLPYYITSPIIHKIIKMKKQPEICVLLIQKEVAEKITADAPESSYLSSFTQNFYNVKIIEQVDKKKFDPVPKVDGAIIKLVKKQNVGVQDIDKFEGFLHRGYSSPRKMLNKPFSKEELSRGGINPKLRPQNLNAQEWLNFYKALSEI